jgi:hypothetical protein
MLLRNCGDRDGREHDHRTAQDAQPRGRAPGIGRIVQREPGRTEPVALRDRHIEEGYGPPHAGREHAGDAADEHEYEQLNVQHQVARRCPRDQLGSQKQRAAHRADGRTENESARAPGCRDHRAKGDRQTLSAADGQEPFERRPPRLRFRGRDLHHPHREFPQTEVQTQSEHRTDEHAAGRSWRVCARSALRARGCRLHRLLGQEQQTPTPRAPLRSRERGLTGGAEQLHGLIRIPVKPSEFVFNLERKSPPRRPVPDERRAFRGPDELGETRSLL